MFLVSANGTLRISAWRGQWDHNPVSTQAHQLLVKVGMDAAIGARWRRHRKRVYPAVTLVGESGMQTYRGKRVQGDEAHV